MTPNALRIQALFEASHVQRWHTMPHHSTTTLGQHMWGVATLVLELCPVPTVPLLRAALRHDVHERWSGDIPSPARKAFPQLLQAGEDATENLIWPLLDHRVPTAELSEEEVWWLRFCDTAEAFLWTKHEHALGNAYVRNANSALYNALDCMAKELDAPVGSHTAFYTLQRLSNQRLPDDPNNLPGGIKS